MLQREQHHKNENAQDMKLSNTIVGIPKLENGALMKGKDSEAGHK